MKNDLSPGEITQLGVFRTKILEYFSAAPLAHVVETLEIASGTVESRRVAETGDKT